MTVSMYICCSATVMRLVPGAVKADVGAIAPETALIVRGKNNVVVHS